MTNIFRHDPEQMFTTEELNYHVLLEKQALKRLLQPSLMEKDEVETLLELHQPKNDPINT